MTFTMMNIGLFYIRRSDQNTQGQLESDGLLKKNPKHWRLIWNKHESKKAGCKLGTAQGPSSHLDEWERIEKTSKPCLTSHIQTLHTKTGETAWTGCFQAQ